MGNNLSNSIVGELSTYLFRAVKRKTRRFNAIPRAEKAIEKVQENPSRAPIHETTQKLVEQLLKEHPEKLNEVTEKDENLHKNLESVYVKSTGKNTEIFSRKRFPDSYGYRVMRTRELDQNVPEGKYNSTRAEHFLAAHERDPKVYSAESLADVYKVDSDAMKNILEYVKIYSVALPVKKIGEPGPMRQMAQDLIPGGLHAEPEIRVVERKIELAKDKMAKLYNQKHEKREKLLYDMNLFESLVALKPMVKKLKDEMLEGVAGAKSVKELNTKLTSEFIFKPESKNEIVDTPENIPKNVNDESMIGKTKEKLIKFGVLESQEEIKEQKEGDKLRAELHELYVHPYESIAENVTVSSPKVEKEHYFALQTKRQLENVLLLENKKKDDEKNDVTKPSSDSAEVKAARSDDLKTQYVEKMSDKG